MNNEFSNRTGWSHLILAGLYLGLPCLCSGLFFATAYPYHLPGKQFLVVYQVQIPTGLLLLTRYPGRRAALLLLSLAILIFAARLGQGIVHHKPVGYLCLLFLLQVFLLGTRATRRP